MTNWMGKDTLFQKINRFYTKEISATAKQTELENMLLQNLSIKVHLRTENLTVMEGLMSKVGLDHTKAYEIKVLPQEEERLLIH